MTMSSDAGVILGVDYGSRRLGFAVSDAMGMMALPLEVREVHDPGEAVQAVCQLCASRPIAKIVVGLPLNMDGTEGPAVEKVRAFVEQLAEAVTIPIETYDERLSTVSAERILLEADTSRKKRKKVIDKLAAQIFLQAYLDAHQVNP